MDDELWPGSHLEKDYIAATLHGRQASVRGILLTSGPAVTSTEANVTSHHVLSAYLHLSNFIDDASVGFGV